MSISDIVTLINLCSPVLVFLISIGFNSVYARLNRDQQEAVRNTAMMVVPAIQQTAMNLSNAAKREQAIKTVESILYSLGYKSVHRELLSAAVESAVFAMKQTRIPDNNTQPLNV